MEKDKLKAKQAEAKSKFEQLEQQREKLVKQRSTLDRNIAEIAHEQVRLQGEHRVLNELLDGDNPDLKIPKKDKK